MDRLLVIGVIAVLGALLLLRVPAPPPAPAVATVGLEQAALGAIERAGRQEFARQRVQLRYAGELTPDGPLAGLAALGVRTTYTIIIIGQAAAVVDLTPPRRPAVSVGPDGTAVLTLPTPTLEAEIRPADVSIYVGEDRCIDLICGGYDRLDVLQQLVPQAEADLITQAAAAGLADRGAEEARAFYTDLLRQAGVTASVTFGRQP